MKYSNREGYVMGWSTSWNLPAIDITEGLVSGKMLTKTSLDADNNLKIEHIEAVKVHLNKVPTHDPYSNPNSHIYYECSCGSILDPGTKSFASLNNHASQVGWKIRFREVGYVPYCVKCGDKVE
jgi:hypothetical protein